MADDGVEFLRQQKMIGVGTVVFNIWGGPFRTCDDKHWFRDVDGQHGFNVPGKIVGKNAGATANVENPTTALRKMLEKKSGAAFERGDKVVFIGKMVEGLGIIVTQSSSPERMTARSLELPEHE